MKPDNRNCHYCGEAEPEPGDHRPYGPGGTWTCHACGQLPENIETTNNGVAVAMEQALAMSGMVVLTNDGPVPVTSVDQVNALMGDGNFGVYLHDREGDSDGS